MRIRFIDYPKDRMKERCNFTPMIRKYGLVLLALFGKTCFHSGQLQAQAVLPEFTCPVSWYGKPLADPFQGGWNAPQFSEPDLDNDGLADLVVFDRAGDVLVTYLRRMDGGDWRFERHRAFAGKFPRFTSWMVMRDYDGDGIRDLFVFSDRSKSGFRAYRGRYVADTLTFDLYPVPGTTDNIFTFTLPNGTKTQIYIAFDDIPAFDDIDGDGDIDLVTFDPSGGHAYLFRNLSTEKGFGRDSLDFSLADVCWGKFYETGVSEPIHLSDNPSECQSSFSGGESQAGLRHAGSTLLTLDANGDGLKDLLIGDVSFTNVNLLINGGTEFNAWMVAQDTFWPASDVRVDMPYFPAAFSLDADLDGRQDIIVAPNAVIGALDTANIWLYRDEGAGAVPDFRLKAKDFLCRDVIDAGTGSRPAFMDVDGDGLTDMIIGNFGFYTPGTNLTPSLVLFRNTGTTSDPAFTLADVDFLGFSAFGQNNLFGFTPATGDLDGDGDVDLVVGHAFGTMFFVENIAGPGNVPVFTLPVADYSGLAPGAWNVPQIVDVDGDGLQDLLVGIGQGRVILYRNTGTPGNPSFSANPDLPPNSSFYGQIDMRTPSTFSGYAAPWFYRTATGAELLVGSNEGQIRRYLVNTGDPGAKFPVLDSLYTGYRDGSETRPVMTDLEGDGRYELFIGNRRGGLTAYQTELEVVTSLVPSPLKPYLQLVYASSSRMMQLIRKEDSSDPLQISVFDLLGRPVLQVTIPSGQSGIRIPGLPPSLYLVQVSMDGHTWTEKLWIP